MKSGICPCLYTTGHFFGPALKEMRSKKSQRNPKEMNQGARTRDLEPIAEADRQRARAWQIRDPGMTYTQPGMTYTPRIGEPISSLDELEPGIADQGARLSVFRFLIGALQQLTNQTLENTGRGSRTRTSSPGQRSHTRERDRRALDRDPGPRQPRSRAAAPGRPGRSLELDDASLEGRSRSDTRISQGDQGDRRAWTRKEPPRQKKRAPQGPLSNAWTLIEP